MLKVEREITREGESLREGENQREREYDEGGEARNLHSNPEAELTEFIRELFCSIAFCVQLNMLCCCGSRVGEIFAVCWSGGVCVCMHV